jgi:putative ABC transport system ATP-binding protein
VPILAASHITKTYRGPETSVHALRDASLSVEAGEFVAVAGPSGCGKSTLLHLCGAMDRPSSGQILLDGVSLGELDEEKLTTIRRDRIGFVFQFFNLLPTLTVLENIALPLLLAGVPPDEAEWRASATGEQVELTPRLAHFPAQLSGGEAQRTAIARAIVHKPVLLIADEPTGNLDSATGQLVIELLKTLNRTLGVTILLATHADDLARAATRRLTMKDGALDPR